MGKRLEDFVETTKKVGTDIANSSIGTFVGVSYVTLTISAVGAIAGGYAGLLTEDIIARIKNISPELYSSRCMEIGAVAGFCIPLLVIGCTAIFGKKTEKYSSSPQTQEDIDRIYRAPM